MRRFLLLLVPLLAWPEWPLAKDAGPCRPWEFRCGNDRCISPNRYCDGTDDCGDSSDETTNCSNCNQTLMGEVDTKYPLRITEPFYRNLPFNCKLHLVAGGGHTMGETIEITFLSFQIGALSIDRNGSEDGLACRSGHLRLSESHDDFYLGDDGTRTSGSTLRSQQTRGFSQLISAFKEPPTHKLSTLYDLTANMEPDFGLFCGNLISSTLGVTFFSTGNNVTLSVYLPPRSSVGATSMMGSFGLYLTYRFLAPISHRNTFTPDSEPAHLGNHVANTYCDRTFANCDRKKCLIRSPNFPGLYLRNFTCNFFVRQDSAPPGKRARIVVHQPNEYRISVNTGPSHARSDSRKAVNQGNSGLSTDCAGDHVNIYDRIHFESKTGRSLLTSFCETGALSDVVSSGPEMLVQLVSAPANLLYESRLELEIRVDFDSVDDSAGAFAFDDDSRCHMDVDGTRTRSGVLQSPRHSVPRNTTCVARLRGSASQRLWIYFVSYFVLDREVLGSDHSPFGSPLQLGPRREDSCDISSLELDLDVPRNATLWGFGKHPSNRTLKFCEKTLPVMCTRAGDYERFVPKRSCMPPAESYLSEGSDVVLRYSVFLRDPTVISSLSATSFVVRYEFVDFEAAPAESSDAGACGANISSNASTGGLVESSKNVFFFGRGGKESLNCVYNLFLKPKERVTIEIADFKTSVYTCMTSFNSRLKRFNCRFNVTAATASAYPYLTAPHRHSLLTFTETSAATTVFVGCICDSPASPPVVFTSSYSERPSVATLAFRVAGMTAFEDFEDYRFRFRFQFLSSPFNEKECVAVPDPHGRNRTHGGELTFRAVPSKHQIKESTLRCQWFLQSSSPETYLYLQLQGRRCDGRHELDDRNRVILYSRGHNGLMYPKTVLCLTSSADPPARSGHDVFDFFSTAWHHNDSTTAPLVLNDDFSSFVLGAAGAAGERNLSAPDTVIVELMAFRPGALTVRWLEVTRLTSGQRQREAVDHPPRRPGDDDDERTLRNVNCLFECPELSACINPELWCDGVVHCPHSAFDESADNCQQPLTLYLAAGIGGLVFCVCAGLVVFFVFRRFYADSRQHQQTHPEPFDHLPHCLQHNSGAGAVEFGKNHVQGASPVFVMGGSMTKKKKKSHKDDYIRHLQAVEVRYPDIHM